MRNKIEFDKSDNLLIKKLSSLLGEEVKIDMTKCPKWYGKQLDKGDRYFTTTIVGINKLNCGNNGHQDNNGELIGYPDPAGTNWCNIDLKSII